MIVLEQDEKIEESKEIKFTRSRQSIRQQAMSDY